MSSMTRTIRWDPETQECVEVTGERPQAKLRGSIGPTSARSLLSDSAGVLPHQVPEARQLIKERQLVGVDIQDDGRAVFTSRGNTGRNGWNKMRGMTDGDGGLGDV